MKFTEEDVPPLPPLRSLHCMVPSRKDFGRHVDTTPVHWSGLSTLLVAQSAT